MRRKHQDPHNPASQRLLAGLGAQPMTGDGPAAAALAILGCQYQVMELKRLYRQGWLKRGVDESHAESVADHVFATAMLAMLLAGRPPFEAVDRERAMRMAMVHELGEVYAGDITPVDGVSAEEKHRLEAASLDRVLASLPPPLREELHDLWQDFESGTSPEAAFIRQLDRLEMGLQAMSYHAEGYQGMDEFFASARRSVQEPDLRKILELALSGDWRGTDE